MPRGLSEKFLQQLKSGGRLNWLLERVKQDRTLSLEIRQDYINVYYRGGNLIKVERIAKRGQSSDEYRSSFEKKYLPNDGPEIKRPKSAFEAGTWLKSIPLLKEAMDMWFAKRPKAEREFQQLVARENTFDECLCKATDYYICDIEYAESFGGIKARFDMLAVHWPSDGTARKNADHLPLAIIEMKYGDGALSGDSGIQSHLKHFATFLANPARVKALAEEMTTVLQQKHDLGLIPGCNRFKSISAESPQIIFLIANHDPQSSVLLDEIKKIDSTLLEKFPHGIQFMRSSYLGYGLFHDQLLSLEEMKKSLCDQEENSEARNEQFRDGHRLPPKKRR